jgi:hypothetical protein
MRTMILAAGAALILSTQIATFAKAEEDTTVIRRDHPVDHSTTTVIKKREGVDLLPVPHPTEEKKVIIHHDD